MKVENLKSRICEQPSKILFLVTQKSMHIVHFHHPIELGHRIRRYSRRPLLLFTYMPGQFLDIPLDIPLGILPDVRLDIQQILFI